MSSFLTFLADHRDELGEQILEHLWLTLLSVSIAIIVGVTLGILISKNRRLAVPVLAVVNGVQTIPSIALLGILLPFAGIGVLPAIIALCLYALLPIVRNTYAGIKGIDPAVSEAAVGMGLSPAQVLVNVQLPLAMPIIFAGIRTAFVINVGIATLCALIAAGGLGEFIFRGLGTNNPQMILAGAIPASLMALFFDGLLGITERHIRRLLKPFLIIYFLAMVVLAGWYYGWFSSDAELLEGGFPSEFIERGDGYRGLSEKYNLQLNLNELSIGLMYEALKNEEVDVISGFSTDGRIIAYDLVLLEDDLQYFPPYYAAPLVRNEIREAHPEVDAVLGKLEMMITDSAMANMNYQVDEFHLPIVEVAQNFLRDSGFRTTMRRTGTADIHIGSKDFTESYLLAEIFKLIIENYTSLTAEVHLGFGSTMLLFDAMREGSIDIYPEYTGTGLLVILPENIREGDTIRYEPDIVYDFVRKQFHERYDIHWGVPLGFNNTFALMMRKEKAKALGIRSVSDLAKVSE